MFEASSMVPESFFEWCFKSTEISFTFIVGYIRDLCFIQNIGYKTFIVQKTFISNSEISSKILFSGIKICLSCDNITDSMFLIQK